MPKTKSNAIPNNPFTNADGAAILAAIKTGKRSPYNYWAAIDEMDRRVTNRITAGKAITAPIVEAMAVLDKRGIAHAGPKATEVKVLTVSEKVGRTDEVPSNTGVPEDYRYSDHTVTLTPVKAEDPIKVLRHKAAAEAKEAAALLTEQNGKGFVKNLIHATKEARLANGLTEDGKALLSIPA